MKPKDKRKKDPRPANCHPERLAVTMDGLCQACYIKKWRIERKKAFGDKL